MKKTVRIFTVFMLVMCMIISCASCNLRTTLNIDENFKGERYLVLDVSQDEAEVISDDESITDLKSFETLLKSECPEGMEVQSVVRNAATNGYTLTFVIEFKSFEDYKSKVSSVLGREPQIDYKKDDNLFYPGYTLKEDFNSGDLLKWAADKLVEKQFLNNADISDITYSSTSVKLNSAVTETSDSEKKKIDVQIINPQEIRHIAIKTKFLGNNLVDRTISFCIPETTVSRLTVEKIDEYFKSIAPTGSECTWDRSVDERYYNINFSALISDLGQKTASVLNIPVYPIKYTTDSQEQNGFTFSYDYEENLDFSSWPINANKTCPVKIEYRAADGSSLTAAYGWKLSGDMTTLNYESASASKVAVKFKNAATYTPTNVNIKLTQLDARRFSRSMTFIFSETTTDNGPQRLKSYLSSYLSKDMKAEIGKSASGYSQLTVTGEGTLEEISEMFSELLGGQNTLTTSEKRRLLLKKQISVEDSNSLTVSLRASKFAGVISYEFESTGSSSIKDAVITDMNDSILQRLIPDNETNKISYTSGNQEFKTSFVVETYDLLALAVAGGGILLLILIIVLISASAAKRKKKKPIMEEEVKKKNEKNVARRMAGVTTENKIATNNSNMIVVEQDYDDGLSRPDDESEGSWLLVNTIRILAVAAAVLFFLPFATISINKAIIDKDAWISGLNMLLGDKISLGLFGLTGQIAYEGNLKSMILILIPVVMVLIISIRKWIKPTIAYLFTAVLSIAQIVYLISVPSYIKNLAQVLKTSNNVSGIDYEMGFAYTWSVIIYIVISVVLLFVIFAEFGRLRRIAKSEEYEQQQEALDEEAIPMLPVSDSEITEHDEAVNEIVENAMNEEIASDSESEPIAMPEKMAEPEQTTVIEAPAQVEEAVPAEPVAEPVPMPAEETVLPPQTEQNNPVNNVKRVKAHVKPKTKKTKKAILPSQEEFDENSGY